MTRETEGKIRASWMMSRTFLQTSIFTRSLKGSLQDGNLLCGPHPSPDPEILQLSFRELPPCDSPRAGSRANTGAPD